MCVYTPPPHDQYYSVLLPLYLFLSLRCMTTASSLLVSHRHPPPMHQAPNAGGTPSLGVIQVRTAPVFDSKRIFHHDPPRSLAASCTRWASSPSAAAPWHACWPVALPGSAAHAAARCGRRHGIQFVPPRRAQHARQQPAEEQPE